MLTQTNGEMHTSTGAHVHTNTPHTPQTHTTHTEQKNWYMGMFLQQWIQWIHSSTLCQYANSNSCWIFSISGSTYLWNKSNKVCSQVLLHWRLSEANALWSLKSLGIFQYRWKKGFTRLILIDNSDEWLTTDKKVYVTVSNWQLQYYRSYCIFRSRETKITNSPLWNNVCDIYRCIHILTTCTCTPVHTDT